MGKDRIKNMDDKKRLHVIDSSLIYQIKNQKISLENAEKVHKLAYDKYGKPYGYYRTLKDIFKEDRKKDELHREY